MKINLFFTLTLGTLAMAQTTITKAFNDPVAGNTINNQQVVGTVNNTPSGAGVTYDNSTLTGGPTAATTYVTPSASEIVSYPGSTLKSTDGVNTTFFKQSATKLEITGMVTTQGTLNFNADNATAMSYPLAFGNTVNDNVKGTFTSTAASGLIKGTIAINADANGTLLLGGNTYTNILRVKITQNLNLYQSSDTFYTFPIGSITGTTYQYYNGSSKFPLLSFVTGNISVPLLSINQSTTEAVAQSFTFLGTKDIQFKEEVKVYPNPALDFIKIQDVEHIYNKVNIFSLDGKIVRSMDIRNNEIPVADLQTGTYLMEMIGKNTTKKIKFIKN
ncbi:MAG: T9SS type A sorting domain-containing protein [Bacteroidetes bacterium]|nr:T9SS type A sorting domain-containing protein [Bacteroidota bacterium]